MSILSELFMGGVKQIYFVSIMLFKKSLIRLIKTNVFI